MKKFPSLFVGHGSPLNALEHNKYTANWRYIGENIRLPKAILMLSAHWYKGSNLIQDEKNELIYDMYGFPKELYEVQYPCDTSPELASAIKGLDSANIHIDNSWGTDHGAWSILVHMFPKANVPIVQLSINAGMSPVEQFNLGRKLSSLRDEGVLIIGSGNIVHNLRMMVPNEDEEFSWALAFDNEVRDKILSGDFNSILNYRDFEYSKLAVPTPDHFMPLLYILGTASETETKTVFNDYRTLGSISMTSYIFGDL